MDAEKGLGAVLEALSNIVPPQVRDYIIVVAGVGYLLFHVVRRLIAWIEKRKAEEAERERVEGEESRQRNERYENFLNSELERSRSETSRYREELNELQDQWRAYELRTQEVHLEHVKLQKVEKSLRAYIRYLQKLCNRNRVSFKNLDEAGE